MSRFVFVIVLLLSPTAMAMSQAHQQFVNSMLVSIRQVNHQIIAERTLMQYLQKHWQTHHALTNAQQQQLKALAARYNLTKFTPEKASFWQQLNSRVNTLPEKLVVAQAINESAWGHSRFAKQANNYFGQWCYRKGCGLVPHARDKGASHEVRKFKNQKASVAAYMHNLNTHPSYAHLRSLRQNKASALVLAGALKHYSQRGNAYVKSLQKIIRQLH